MIGMAQDSENQMSASPLTGKALALPQNPPSPGKHITLTQLPHMNLGVPSILPFLIPPSSQMIKPSPIISTRLFSLRFDAT